MDYEISTPAGNLLIYISQDSGVDGMKRLLLDHRGFLGGVRTDHYTDGGRETSTHTTFNNCTD